MSSVGNFGIPAFGGGAGLRSEHIPSILERRPDCRWFEIIVENFLDFGGWIRESFEAICQDYTVIPHGVCLSIGSTDPLDVDFLRRLKPFLDSIDAPCMSDHLCFTMVDHANLNELIPVPFTQESADNIISRVEIVQDILERPFLLENITRYMTVSDREMSEAEFISTIVEKANCGILLDITNVHLNSYHHNFDALDFIKSLPLNRVGQMHLAGFEDDGEVLIDAHDAPVPDAVWALFRETLKLTGPTNALVEWDNNLPTVERLLQESRMADSIMAKVCPEWSSERGDENSGLSDAVS